MCTLCDTLEALYYAQLPLHSIYSHMEQSLGADLEPNSREEEFRIRYCVLVHLPSHCIYIYIYIFIREKLHDFTPPHIRHCFDVILQLI